jgi:hypothetical protein
MYFINKKYSKLHKIGWNNYNRPYFYYSLFMLYKKFNFYINLPIMVIKNVKNDKILFY